MSRHTNRRRTDPIIAGVLAVAMGIGTFLSTGRPGEIREAHAIIGMPWTPLSFAGVARRSAYRSVAYGSAYRYGYPYYGYGYGYGYPAYAGSAAAYNAGYNAGLASLPSGCVKTSVNGAPVYTCGSTAYRAVYQGPNLVYVPTAVP
jgi:hypothetical protein